jgi:hypothetical protein
VASEGNCQKLFCFGECGVQYRRSGNGKTVSEEGDRLLLEAYAAVHAILAPLSSLLIAFPSLFIEITHAIKAALQILRPLPRFVTNRLARGIAAPTKMRMGIGIPAAALIPAIIPAVCLGLHESDVGVYRAARALPLVAPAILGLEPEMFRVEIKPEFLRTGWRHKAYRGRKG